MIRPAFYRFWRSVCGWVMAIGLLVGAEPGALAMMSGQVKNGKLVLPGKAAPKKQPGPPVKAKPKSAPAPKAQAKAPAKPVPKPPAQAKAAPKPVPKPNVKMVAKPTAPPKVESGTKPPPSKTPVPPVAAKPSPVSPVVVKPSAVAPAKTNATAQANSPPVAKLVVKPLALPAPGPDKVLVAAPPPPPLPPLPLPVLNPAGRRERADPELRPMDPDQLEALSKYLGIPPRLKVEPISRFLVLSEGVDIRFAPSLVTSLVLGETAEAVTASEAEPAPAPATEPLALAGPSLAEAESEATDRAGKKRGDALKDGAPILTLPQVLKTVMTDNPELLEKRAKLDEIDAQNIGLKSRFSPHFDMVAQWDRNKNDWLSSNQPPLNLSRLTNSGVSFGSSSLGGFDLGSLGGLDLGGLDIGNLDLNNLDLGNLDLGNLDLGGVDLNSLDLNNLDLNNLDLNDLSTLDPNNLDLSTVDLNGLDVGSIVANNPDLLNQILGQAGSNSSRFNIDENTRLSVRFARRVYEYGRENIQDIQQRERRRQAYVDYEKKLREVLATSRKRFFTGLLKEKQISVRKQLLEEFQGKYERLKTRFEQAQDILKIDVLTSELDVLNERLVINGLQKEKLNSGIELSKLMGAKYNKDLLFAGDLDQFRFDEEDVVRLTQENSFASELLRQQVEDQAKIVKDIVWTWRPQLSLKGGIQYRTFSLGLGVNQSSGTFGLDVGAETYLNLPDVNINSFDGNKEKYAIALGVNVPFYSGRDRESVLERERAILKQLQSRLKTQMKLEEQQGRTAFQTLREARERERLQAERVKISRRRLQITQVLRDSGKVSEVSLETFRDRFFSDQDALFREQNNVIEVQETLRQLMGVFE